MTDKQMTRLCSTIRYLGLCIVRGAVTIGTKPVNAQDLINQTLKEYHDWLAEVNSNDAYDGSA
jgi:hypothetical protein